MKGTFEFKGRRYELAKIESFDFAEALEAQRISGMALGELMPAAAVNDVRAWLALFAVAITRVDPGFNEFDLQGENVTALLASVQEVKEDPPGSEGEQQPATENAPDADGTSSNGGDGNGAADSSSAQTASLEEKDSSLDLATTHAGPGSQ